MSRKHRHEAEHTLSPLQARCSEIIFGTSTPAGKWFDIILLVFIILSVLTVIIESVPEVLANYAYTIDVLEWVFTGVFTIEYIVRIWCARSRLRYIKSFFGIVDFLSIIPTYISLFIPASHTLLMVRALRLIRIFRILKLGRYMSEATVLRTAILASRQKIIVFMTFVAIILVIMASAMYLLEGGTNKDFDSIPDSLYWSVVTMTTVGFGDATPHSIEGKVLAAIMMLIGYSLIIVPTGILTLEISHATRGNAPRCTTCQDGPPGVGDQFCRTCGRSFG